MTRSIFIAAALALAVTLPAAPAQALVARTFLSAAGSDSNNCANVMTPCRHLATAYAATAANGEIYVLDPANYGALTITGPISIQGHGWASIAPVSGSAAITIQANPGDKINIIGVVLDGTALTNTTGIQFDSGGGLTVRDSVIRNFTNDGIHFAPNTSTPSQLYVANTLVSDSAFNGIEIFTGGSGDVVGVLSRVEIVGSGNHGLEVSSTAGTTNVTVSDSVSSNNAEDGIRSDAIMGAVNVTVRNTTVANNNKGLEALQLGANIRLTRSTITGNTTGWAISTGGAVSTFGDNDIFGNGSANNAPTSISHE